MDMMAGFYIGAVFGCALAIVAVIFYYVETTDGWDHRPTKDEILKRVIDSDF